MKFNSWYCKIFGEGGDPLFAVSCCGCPVSRLYLCSLAPLLSLSRFELFSACAADFALRCFSFVCFGRRLSVTIRIPIGTPRFSCELSSIFLALFLLLGSLCVSPGCICIGICKPIRMQFVCAIRKIMKS